MNYTKLASEARKLYTALRDEEFDANQAYEIVKVCIRDYPIFRDMIENEQNPKNAIGYLHFTDGHKEPIYKYICINVDMFEIYTEDSTYRQRYYIEYGGLSFNRGEVAEYLKFTDKDWMVIHTIDDIELF